MCFSSLKFIWAIPTLCFIFLILYLISTGITVITQIFSSKATYFERHGLMNVVLVAGPSAAGVILVTVVMLLCYVKCRRSRTATAEDKVRRKKINNLFHRNNYIHNYPTRLSGEIHLPLLKNHSCLKNTIIFTGPIDVYKMNRRIHRFFFLGQILSSRFSHSLKVWVPLHYVVKFLYSSFF